MSNQMRKLAGQTMVYGISTVLVRLLNYLLVPYLTRVMGRAQYGVGFIGCRNGRVTG